MPWATSASAPASCAATASSGVVTVTMIVRPGPARLLDHLPRGKPEGERHHRHPLLGHDGQPVPPLAVVVHGHAQRHAVPLGLPAQPRRVRVHGGPVGLLGGGHEDVHAERRVGARSYSADAGAQGLGRVVTGGHEPQPARGGHRRGQLRSRRATGHRRLDDRVAQLRELHHPPLTTAGSAPVRAGHPHFHVHGSPKM